MRTVNSFSSEFVVVLVFVVLQKTSYVLWERKEQSK
jgi:hypothetical protein